MKTEIPRSRSKQRSSWRKVLSGVTRVVGDDILGAGFAYHRFRRVFEPPTRTPKRVLLVPPASPGSVGDEAIMNGFISGLTHIAPVDITLLSYHRQKCWSHMQGASGECILHGYLKHGSMRSRLRFASEAARHDVVCLLGTDVMDGHYSVRRSLRRIELLRIAAAVGVHTALVACSFNDQADERVVAALRALPRSIHLYARDPISHASMREALRRPVELVGDPAFLLDPDGSPQSVQRTVEWISQRNRDGMVVIGVNANHSNLARECPSLADSHLVTLFRQALAALHHEDDRLAFCLIPHDARGEVSDVALGEKIYQSLPPHVKSDTYLMRLPLSAAGVKAVARHLFCAFTSRMHLAIACLGQETPVGALTYQGKKFHGLFEHFGLQGLTLDPQGTVTPTAVCSFIRSIIDRRDALREQIRARLPAVRALAMKNCELALPVTLNGEPMVGA